MLFKSWLLCQEGCVHCSEFQIAPSLFTHTLGVYSGQRNRVHLLHHPGEIRFTQASRWGRARWVDDLGSPWRDVITDHISFNQRALLTDSPGACPLGDGPISREMCLKASQVAKLRQFRPERLHEPCVLVGLEALSGLEDYLQMFQDGVKCLTDLGIRGDVGRDPCSDVGF